MCKGGGSGGGTNTVTTQSGPPAPVLAQYQNLIGQANNQAQQPLNQYAGNMVAGFTPQQLQAFQQIQNSQGVADPYINSAAQMTAQGATPIQPTQFSADQVQQYMSPYTQNVVDATQAQFNNQNQQQQQQVIGNAISQGAWGGDRSAIAQAETANQQQLAQAPVIAGLYNQGYGQALGEFNAQQQVGVGAQEATGWLGENAAFGLGALGTQAQNSALTGANANLQAGALQQQLSQEALNIPYEQFTQQQAYPFQTLGWDSGISEGLGSGSGGNSSTSSPGASPLSSIAGLGVTGIAGYNALNQAGVFNSAPAAAVGYQGTLAGGAGALTAENSSIGAADAAFAAIATGGRVNRDAGGRIHRAGGGYIGFDPWASTGSTTTSGPDAATAAKNSTESSDASTGGTVGEVAGAVIGNTIGLPFGGTFWGPIAGKIIGEQIGGYIGSQASGGRVHRDMGGAISPPPLPGIVDASSLDYLKPAQQQGSAPGRGPPPPPAQQSQSDPMQQSMQLLSLANNLDKMSAPKVSPDALDTAQDANGGRVHRDTGGSTFSPGAHLGPDGLFGPGGTGTVATQFGPQPQSSMSPPPQPAASGSGGGFNINTPSTWSQFGYNPTDVQGGSGHDFSASVNSFLGQGQQPSQAWNNASGLFKSQGLSQYIPSTSAQQQTAPSGPTQMPPSGWNPNPASSQSQQPQQQSPQTSSNFGIGGYTLAPGRGIQIPMLNGPQQQTPIDINPTSNYAPPPVANSPTNSISYPILSGTNGPPSFNSYPSLSAASQNQSAAMSAAAPSPTPSSAAPSSQWTPGMPPPNLDPYSAGYNPQLAAQYEQYNVSSANGGRIHRDMGGGIASIGAANAGVPGAAAAPGTPQSQMLQRFMQLPPEKLQELSVRIPPSNPQGAIIQRALQMKRMQPQQAGGQSMMNPAAPQQPQSITAPQGAMSPTPPPPLFGGGMANGGRAHFDDGGPAVYLPLDQPDYTIAPSNSRYTGMEQPRDPVMAGPITAPHQEAAGPPSPPSAMSRAFAPTEHPGNLHALGSSGPVTSGANITFPLSESKGAPTVPEMKGSPGRGAGYEGPGQLWDKFMTAVSSPDSPYMTKRGMEQATNEAKGVYGDRVSSPGEVGTGDAPGSSLIGQIGAHPTSGAQAAEARPVAPPPEARPVAPIEQGPPGAAPQAGGLVAPHFTTTPATATVPASPPRAGGSGSPSMPPHPEEKPEKSQPTITVDSDTGTTMGNQTMLKNMAGAHQQQQPQPQQPAAHGQSTVGKLASSPWLALAAAGAGMMAGRSPHAMENIGAGLLTGVKTLESQNAAEQKGQEIEDTRNYRQGDLSAKLKQIDSNETLHRDQVNREAQRDKNTAEYQQGEIARQKARDAAEIAYRSEALNQGKYVWYPGDDADPNDPNKRVTGSWRYPTRGGDEKPQFYPGANMARSAGAQTMLSRQQLAPSLFPNDPGAQADFIAGKKMPNPLDIQKAADGQAQRELGTLQNSPAGAPPDPQAWLLKRKADIEQQYNNAVHPQQQQQAAPQFKSATDVGAAVKAGKLPYEDAAKILREQFGYQ